MKLNELKQGMVCKLRNSDVITILDDGKKYYLYDSIEEVGNLIDVYNEDLMHKRHSFFDIMQITYGNEVVFQRHESRWFVPEMGEEYYFLNPYGDVNSFINTKDKADDRIINNQRVFKTKEEAEKRLKQQQATLSVERWIAENDVEVDLLDEDVRKYHFTYDVETKEFKISSYYYRIITPKQFILSSEEKVLQLIKEREKELKIMFGVEE